MAKQRSDMHDRGQGKKRNQKMKPYLVYHHLLRKTDENHTIKADDICVDINDIYGIEAERRGIYRDIDEINKAILAYEEQITIEEAEEMLQEAEEDGDNSLKTIVWNKHKKGFYVNQRHYDYTDIQLLAESIYASKFLSEAQAKRLIDNVVCDYVSEYQAKTIKHNVLLTDRVKTNNSGVLDNLAKINAAMSREVDGKKHIPEKISFKYLKYSINNLNKQVERRQGERYEVSPYALLINDSNYYLLAYNSEKGKIWTYRVDRMKDVRPTGAEREGREEFEKINLKSYTQRVFGMFGGKQEIITIRFVNSLLDTVVDRFGKKGILYAGMDESHFTITAPIEVSNQFYGWVLGFGNKAKIMKPENVVNGFKEYLDKVRNLYES